MNNIKVIDLNGNDIKLEDYKVSINDIDEQIKKYFNNIEVNFVNSPIVQIVTERGESIALPMKSVVQIVKSENEYALIDLLNAFNNYAITENVTQLYLYEIIVMKVNDQETRFVVRYNTI